jgi:hypothetical protein
VVNRSGTRFARPTRKRTPCSRFNLSFAVLEGANDDFEPNDDFKSRSISFGGGGTTNVPSPSEPPGQPSDLPSPSDITGQTSEPYNQQPKPSNQPSGPDPATDDTPPSMVDDSDESDPDDEDKVMVNSRLHSSTTTKSGRRVRPPNRMNLNAMKVKELNAIKANNSQELKKKLANQKVRACVLNHQFISSIKWTQLKSIMIIGQLGGRLGNLHQDTDQDLGTVENINQSVFAAKSNSEDMSSYEEAMHGPLAGEFRKALEVEWDILSILMKAWQIVGEIIDECPTFHMGFKIQKVPIWDDKEVES